MPSEIDQEIMHKKTMANQPFDINHPPLKSIPHQEFPKMLYLWPKDKKLHPTAKTNTAQSAEEEKTLLAKGYRAQPHKQEFEEEVPDGFEADVAGEPVPVSKSVDAMTKAELLAHAKEAHGLDVDPALKKEQILQAIQEASKKTN